MHSSFQMLNPISIYSTMIISPVAKSTPSTNSHNGIGVEQVSKFYKLPVSKT